MPKAAGNGPSCRCCSSLITARPARRSRVCGRERVRFPAVPTCSPYIGHRRRVTPDFFSLAAIGYGTELAEQVSGREPYSATRLGAEVAADIRLLEVADFVSVHWQIGAQVTELDATGN